MELPGDRTQWVQSDIRITKKETIRMDGFLWYPNTIDQLLTRTGILRRLRRLRVASAFVLTAGQNQRHCIPLPCLRMELPGDRTQWVQSDIRITKKETIRMDGFLWYPNTIDQLLTRTGILRRLRRLRVASAFVLTAGQNQRHCIPLPCLRMELPGDRTQWVQSDIRITKKETIRMDGFLWYPNTIDQLLTRTGILRRLRRLRVASAFVLTAGQNQRHCIPLPCLRMELPGDRTQWVQSDIRITKKETIRMDGFFFGDPYGNRTHITAVKGRCLNLLTNGPGSGNLTRTDDTPGMNRMLYQLSYAAIFTCAASHGHDVL